jgi:hypothetical protein
MRRFGSNSSTVFVTQYLMRIFIRTLNVSPRPSRSGPSMTLCTLVRETNNIRAAGWKASLSPVGRNPKIGEKSIAKSLVRLKLLAGQESGA